MEACTYNNLRGVKHLVKKRGINPLSSDSVPLPPSLQQGNSALLYAVRANNSQIVSFLLEAAKGSDLRLNRPFGEKRRTLLSFAANNKSPEIVRVLLKSKASPNALDAVSLPLPLSSSLAHFC